MLTTLDNIFYCFISASKFFFSTNLSTFFMCRTSLIIVMYSIVAAFEKDLMQKVIVRCVAFFLDSLFDGCAVAFALEIVTIDKIKHSHAFDELAVEINVVIITNSTFNWETVVALFNGLDDDFFPWI